MEGQTNNTANNTATTNNNIAATGTPTPNASSATNSSLELNRLLDTVNHLTKELADLKANPDNTKTKVDPLKGAISEHEQKTNEAQRNEYLTAFYAEVKTNFAKAYGAEAKQYETKLKDVTSLEDKINYMARAIIRKSFGDCETTNNLLDSFKSSVTNSDSAFNAKYQAAVEKLNQDKSSINANLFNQRAEDISLAEMFKLRNDLVDFRTRNTAKTKAKALGFIAA